MGVFVKIGITSLYRQDRHHYTKTKLAFRNRTFILRVIYVLDLFTENVWTEYPKGC